MELNLNKEAGKGWAPHQARGKLTWCPKHSWVGILRKITEPPENEEGVLVEFGQCVLKDQFQVI